MHRFHYIAMPLKAENKNAMKKMVIAFITCK
jgi:hypothetical protein